MNHAHLHRFLTAALAAVVLFAGICISSSEPASATLAGRPGLVQPGNVVYSEDFSSRDATGSAISLLDYAGGPSAAYGSYTADVAYTPAGGQCNGWILNSLSPLPQADTGCARNQPGGWQQVQAMAIALGQAQGQSPAEAAHNQVLSEYTNHASGQIDPGIQFRTLASGVKGIAGHYYAVTAYFAHVNCYAAHAKETFSLLVDGSPLVLSAGLDPCGTNTSGGGTEVRKLQSAAYRVPAGTEPSLGLEVRNEAHSGAGNDVAFDAPQIVDVTPQLDVEFSPSLIGPGGTSTVTLTVTNTSDLLAKNDWSLVNNLPPGVVIAASPSVGGTCAQGAGTAPLVIVAHAGGGEISVAGGDLLQGMASCTISAEVTAASEGTYANGPSTMDTSLNPPTNSTLTVRAPRLEISSRLNGSRLNDADQFTPEIRSDQVTGGVVSNSAHSSTTGTGAAVGAGSGTTGQFIAGAGATYYVTQAASNPSGYSRSITCSDASGLQPGLPSAVDFTGSLALAPVAGAAITCVITNTATAVPALELIQSADDSALQFPAAVGNRIIFSFTARNTGNVALKGVAVQAVIPGLPDLHYSWPGVTGELLPGQAAVATAAYAVTQADIDAGQVTGSSSATGTPVVGSPLLPVSAESVTALSQSPAMAFSSSADGPSLQSTLAPGEEVKYWFTSENTGNVTLTGVTITAGLPGLSTLDYHWPGVAGILLPGQAVTASALYAVTPTDLAAGRLGSWATSAAVAPNGAAIRPPNGTMDVQLAPDFGMETSTSTDASGVGKIAKPGDVIIHTFTLKNTGPAPLNDVVVNGGEASFASLEYSWRGVPGTLLPGESVTATATYTLSRADLAAGSVVTAITASARPGGGEAVTTKPARITMTFPRPVPENPSGQQGFLAITGAMMGVLPMGLLIAGLGLALLVMGRRKGAHRGA